MGKTQISQISFNLFRRNRSEKMFSCSEIWCTIPWSSNKIQLADQLSLIPLFMAWYNLSSRFTWSSSFSQRREILKLWSAFTRQTISPAIWSRALTLSGTLWSMGLSAPSKWQLSWLKLWYKTRMNRIPNQSNKSLHMLSTNFHSWPALIYFNKSLPCFYTALSN